AELEHLLRDARYDRIKKEQDKDAPYNQREEFRNRPAELDDVKYAKLPEAAIWVADFASEIPKVEAMPGGKMLANRMRKVVRAANGKERVALVTDDGRLLDKLDQKLKQQKENYMLSYPRDVLARRRRLTTMGLNSDAE